MTDLDKESVALHAELHGKLEVQSKVALHNRKDLSLAYTPGVAQVCQEIAADPARVFDLTLKHNTVAVVSDGSAILGIGNLGRRGGHSGDGRQGRAVQGVRRRRRLPDLPRDAGRRRDRHAPCALIAPVFGGINLEDISAPRCFEVEARLQDLGIPVFHDDQHGTAIVVLAALLNALKVAGKTLDECTIVFNGSGASAIACARLILSYGELGRAPKPGDIILCDSKGIVHRDRTDLNAYKRELAERTNKRNLHRQRSPTRCAAPTSSSACRRATWSRQEMVRSMHQHPIILAMANPIPEIMPDAARDAGAAVVGTGRSDFPNQINNVLAFPGVFRGALDAGATVVNEEMKIAAAEALAGYVIEPTPERILPDPLDKHVAPAHRPRRRRRRARHRRLPVSDGLAATPGAFGRRSGGLRSAARHAAQPLDSRAPAGIVRACSAGFSCPRSLLAALPAARPGARSPSETIAPARTPDRSATISGPRRRGQPPDARRRYTIGETSGSAPGSRSGPVRDDEHAQHAAAARCRRCRSGPMTRAAHVARPAARSPRASAGAVKHDIDQPLGERISRPAARARARCRSRCARCASRRQPMPRVAAAARRPRCPPTTPRRARRGRRRPRGGSRDADAAPRRPQRECRSKTCGRRSAARR